MGWPDGQGPGQLPLGLAFVCKGLKPLYAPLSSAKGTVSSRPASCLEAVQKLGGAQEDFQIQVSLSL